ncbi:MAG: hypothetical protein ACK42L_10700, partial [Thermoanaerobaculum sp.]
FCSRCKLSRESQTYCTQCVNIFLKRDMVAPELQIAKHRQLRRRQILHQALRRFLDFFLPGFGQAFYGRPLVGVILMIPAAFLLTAATLWLPHFVQPLVLQAELLPIRVFLALLWLALLVFAQLQRHPER